MVTDDLGEAHPLASNGACWQPFTDHVMDGVPLPRRRRGTGESQALRKVIKALATTGGQFSASDAWLFSAETFPLVATLVEARY